MNRLFITIFFLIFFISDIRSMLNSNVSSLQSYLPHIPLQNIVLDYIGDEEWRVPYAKVEEDCINSVAISADSKILITASQNIVKSWNLENGEHIKTITLPSERRYLPGFPPTIVKDDTPNSQKPNIEMIAISRDNKYLALVLDNHFIEIRDIGTLEKLRYIFHEAKNPLLVSFSPDNRYLALGAHKLEEGEEYLYIWNLEETDEGKQLVDTVSPFDVYCNDKKYQGNYANSSNLWNVMLGGSLKKYRGYRCVILSYNNLYNRIISNASIGNEDIHVYNLNQSKKYISENKNLISTIYSPITTDFDFLLDSKTDIIMDLYNKNINLTAHMSHADKSQFVSFKNKTSAHLKGRAGPITALACSPDGRYIVTGSENGTLLVWVNQKAAMLEPPSLKSEYKTIKLQPIISTCTIL